jgi:hypothetical protein
MAITSKWTARNFSRIMRGTSKQYQEIMRIVRIAFPGFTLMDEITIASRAYCHMAAGQEHWPWPVAVAFRKHTNSSWGTGHPIPAPPTSDEEKVVAIQMFYDKTKPKSWDNWRVFMKSQGVG